MHSLGKSLLTGWPADKNLLAIAIFTKIIGRPSYVTESGMGSMSEDIVLLYCYQFGTEGHTQKALSLFNILLILLSYALQYT